MGKRADTYINVFVVPMLMKLPRKKGENFVGNVRERGFL